MAPSTIEYETANLNEPLRVGSLCTGFGGLDLAVEHVLGARMDWCAESDPHAAQVLAAHWPGVPNFGDLRTVDWLCAPPVDIVTAGFPCQPVSNAGRRKGTEDDRWLWPDVAEALRWIRPRYVVLENVAAIVNRGMDTVLGSLATLGFDAVWGCYRASWAGAPHRRDRWFLYGWRQGLPGPAADAAGQRLLARQPIPFAFVAVHLASFLQAKPPTEPNASVAAHVDQRLAAWTHMWALAASEVLESMERPREDDLTYGRRDAPPGA